MALTFDSPESLAALAAVRFPAVPEQNCSANETGSCAGTAATEKNWIALEHPGSWGRDVLDGTAFDLELSQRVGAAVKKAGDFKFVLIRKPGSRGLARLQDGATRRVFITRENAGRQELFTFTVSGPEDLLDLPLTEPEKIPEAERWDSQVITLICAHAKRDQCCALRGRPIAKYLAALRPENTVWECSHISGHRFAPTGLVLPSGYTYGRLTPETALAATVCLEDAEVPVLENLRGQAGLSEHEQVAEIAVRELLFKAGEEPRTGTLSFEAGAAASLSLPGLEELPEKAKLTRVRHDDGRAWLVASVAEKVGPVRASCGKGEKMASSLRVLRVIELEK